MQHARFIALGYPQPCRITFIDFVAWKYSRHFATPPLVSSQNDVWETTAEIHIDGVSLPMGSDTSWVWNFSFSNVISRGNQWRRREMSTVFSGYQIQNQPAFIGSPILMSISFVFRHVSRPNTVYCRAFIRPTPSYRPIHPNVSPLEYKPPTPTRPPLKSIYCDVLKLH